MDDLTRAALGDLTKRVEKLEANQTKVTEMLVKLGDNNAKVISLTKELAAATIEGFKQVENRL